MTKGIASRNNPPPVDPTTTNPEKAALLGQMAALFPVVDPADTKPLNDDGCDWPERLRRDYVHFEHCMLPYWLSLAPAYAEAMARPFGGDTAHLKTHVYNWPASFDVQQAQLHHLLSTSKLREPWHRFCQLLAKRHTCKDKEQRQQLDVQEKTLDQALDDGKIPLKEIPLYQGYIRVSCQQLICLPEAEWSKLVDNRDDYAPGNVDPQTVERLATRIAQVFNAPPLVSLHLLEETPSWSGAIVWNGSQRMLTCAQSQHGIRDRLLDEYDRPHDGVENQPLPDWRYMGFCGQIGVALEDGSPWIVCVLAPQHFIRRMMFYPQWYQRG
jgi:hypothetical protein